MSRLLLVLMVLGSAGCSSDDTAATTYVDGHGHLYYETDCPDIDPLILGVADGLPNVETTTLAYVTAEAGRFPDGYYRVIPRNGWVWERVADGSVRVFQTEDYMLERTLESVDDCPATYGFPGGVPVAYVVSDE